MAEQKFDDKQQFLNIPSDPLERVREKRGVFFLLKQRQVVGQGRIDRGIDATQDDLGHKNSARGPSPSGDGGIGALPRVKKGNTSGNRACPPVRFTHRLNHNLCLGMLRRATRQEPGIGPQARPRDGRETDARQTP
jgi:hypothetical protein